MAFVNTFLYKTASFLDQFLAQCENRFLEFEVQLRRVDTQLRLLEAKLESIPALEATSVINTENTSTKTNSTTNLNNNEQESNTQDTDTVDNQSENVNTNPEQSPEQVQIQSSAEGVKAKDDFRYKKYFNMVKFGVPAAAIKMKMQAEGVDPNILDNPDTLLADGVIEPIVSDSDSNSD